MTTTFPVTLTLTSDPRSSYGRRQKTVISIYQNWRQLIEGLPITSANHGLRTGQAGRLTVIDIAADSPMLDLITGRKQYQVQTPSGGMHYYYQYEPTLHSIYNTLPGVHVLNDNRYVFAGSGYLVNDDERPIPLMDANLLDRLREQQAIKRPIHQQCYDLFNILPDEWFTDRELYMKFIYVLNNTPMVAEHRLETMRRLLADRFGWYDEHQLVADFGRAMNRDQRRFLLATLSKIVKASHPVEHAQWKKPATQANGKLRYRHGALTKLSEIKAARPDLTAKKLLEMNSDYTTVTKNICKSCRNRHLARCCLQYKPKQHTTSQYVNNIEII